MQKTNEKEEWLCLVLEVPEAEEVPVGPVVIAAPAGIMGTEVITVPEDFAVPVVITADLWAAITVTDPLHHPLWAAATAGLIAVVVAAAAR